MERWFTARGTPHLIEDYSATEDVFTRALPVLNLGLRDVAALLAIWALVNRSRGLRALARPARVGRGEIAVFVLAPPLITALIGAQPGQALGLAAVNVVLLGGIYGITSYGLVPLTRWAFAKTVRELGAVAGLVGRALPLLLLIQIVLFINTEMWQVADGFDGAALAAVITLFFVIGTGFLLSRLPRELDRLGSFATVAEVDAQVVSTPVEEMARGPEVLRAPALSRRQRGNVLLVALFSQGVQVVLVTVLLGAFFVAFGLLTITPTVLDSWLGHRGDELLHFGLLGRDV